MLRWRWTVRVTMRTAPTQTRKRYADLKRERCVLWSATAAARNGHERGLALNAARPLRRPSAQHAGARSPVDAHSQADARSPMAHPLVVSDAPPVRTGVAEVVAVAAC
jgi:hypothetical protein